MILQSFLIFQFSLVGCAFFLYNRCECLEKLLAYTSVAFHQTHLKRERSYPVLLRCYRQTTKHEEVILQTKKVLERNLSTHSIRVLTRNVALFSVPLSKQFEVTGSGAVNEVSSKGRLRAHKTKPLAGLKKEKKRNANTSA